MSWAEEQSWFGLEDLVIAEQEEYEELLANNLWKTAKGEILKVSNMTTHHLKMCINKIKRDNWRKDYLPILIKELNKRMYP